MDTVESGYEVEAIGVRQLLGGDPFESDAVGNSRAHGFFPRTFNREPIDVIGKEAGGRIPRRSRDEPLSASPADFRGFTPIRQSQVNIGQPAESTPGPPRFRTLREKA